MQRVQTPTGVHAVRWRLSHRQKQLVLLAHILSSVGLFGMTIVSVALAIVAVSDPEPSLLRAVLAILELVDQLLLPPLAFTSVITGLVLSLGTPWGLLNHFWIVAKLVISIVVILTGAIVIRAAVHAAMSVAALPEFASSGAPGGNVAALLLGLYAGHLLLLGIATALTIYKPFGLTPRGRNRARLARAVTRASSVASRAPAAASATTTRIVTARQDIAHS